MNRLIRLLTTPLILFIFLAICSFVLGWNLITLFLFWFIMVPVVSVLAPRLFTRNNKYLLESILGLLIFYGLMVFMIYSHYQTDYFKIMVASAVVNVIIVTVLSLSTGKRLTNI